MNKFRIHSSENVDHLVDQSAFCRHTLPNNLMSSQHSQLLVPLQALLRKHRSSSSPKNDIVTSKNAIPVKNSNIKQQIDSTRSNGLGSQGQSPVFHQQMVGPPDYKTALLEIQRRNNLTKSSINTNGHPVNINNNFVRNGGCYNLPLNLTNLYPHSRLPQSGGQVNPTSGLLSPISDILQSYQHGYQQQPHTISTNKNNQPSMRSKQPENLPHPGFNETLSQSFMRQPLGHPEQQYHHRPPQDHPAFLKAPPKSRQQGQLESNIRSIDNSNSNNARHHLHHLPNNNASQQNVTKSANIISPTRRLDLSSSSNSSPHSTIDSKKGRSRSSSQSTPGKSAFAIRRSDDAPVTLQGWLYKQGSDGLMLWKKRWFVLSEFCLFYYKGPDEERCAGSILLPSYKISPVVKEDGVYRKCAFKAEHQNMRTYFFAAETKEAMTQWMNALSLASICQQEHNLKFNGSHDPNGSRLLSPFLKNNRMIPRENYSQTMIVQHHYPPAVHQMYSPSGDAYKYHPKSRQSLRMDSSEAEDDTSSSKQPLYANAPPKPKRMNPSRERESPSPERRVYQVNEENPTLVTAMYQQPRAGVHQAHVIDENTQQGYHQRSAPERRTPEVYGRSTNFEVHQLKRPAKQHQHARQFEDFYNANNNNNFYEPHKYPANHQQYLPPNHQYNNAQKFPGYNHNPIIQQELTKAHQNQHFHHQAQTISTNNFYNAQIQQFHQEKTMRTSRHNGTTERVPRPHSADFLEYEPSKVEEMVPPYRGQAIISRHPNKSHLNQPPRPKSSIEQRIPSEVQHQMLDHQNSNKNSFRLYPTTPQPRRHNMNSNSNQYYQHPQHQLNSRNRNFNVQVQRAPPLAHRSALSLSRDKSCMELCNMVADNTNEEIQHYFPTLSSRRASQTPQIAYQNVPTPNPPRTMQPRLESVTPSQLVSDFIDKQNRLKMAEESTGEFRRSSSARLHRSKQNHAEFFEQMQLGSDETKKKEQREESMKRLLEWKQRMLQSPLTRKSSRNTSRTQTPTNSSSPVPSLTNNDISHQKNFYDMDQNGESNKSHLISTSAAQTPSESRRVSRKGSGASRSSRNRSSPRIQNHLSTSSSEEDVSESSRDSRQHQRRKSGSGFMPPKKDSTNGKLQKFHGNLLNLTAQDLLGKSHEELVLMLIHLRRQSAALNEAIEATKDELQNSANLKTPNSEDGKSGGSDQQRAAIQDLQLHIKELEDKRARGIPIISLVDNMVKLGSLYRGPQDAPLSHRVRNLPVDNIQRNGDFYLKQANKQRRGEIQELLDRSLNLVNKTINSDVSLSKAELNKIMNQQNALVMELEKVRHQLQQSQKKLDHVAIRHSSWENDVLTLRQQLQSSASRDMQYGLGQSAGTLNIESELAHVHHQGSELQRKRTLLSREIDALTQKQEALESEIRCTPNVSTSAESGGSLALKKWTTGIVDTSLDSIASLDQSIADEFEVKNEKNGSQKLTNGVEEEDQGYKTFQQLSNNSYENESNSSNNQSENNPLSNKRVEPNSDSNGNTDDMFVNLTLGDISEADDRVKKFFRILPKDNIKEIKTVRMVKRDSKERSISKTGNCIEDEDAEQSEELVLEEDPPPPPPLPRGSFQNLHDFLNPTGNQQIFGSLPRTISGRIQYSNTDNGNNIVEGSASSKTSTLPRTNFKLGEYYKQKYTKDNEKSPGTGISAHERLFGSSRETSMSPPSSPEKSLSSGRNSSTSPVTSPIFKSAAARAIIEEVGKAWTGSAQKRDKKRSLTITSSHPAVMEALDKHQQLLLQGSNRSRDDIDMERILRPHGHNTPDVIRSALDKNDTNETTIDNLFGAPDKIVIPERYVPESDVDNQTPEERKVRLKKVDSIRRMLAGQHSSGENSHEGDTEAITEERKQREQLLVLNHLIAKQVMEKTRLAAGKSQQN